MKALKIGTSLIVLLGVFAVILRMHVIKIPIGMVGVLTEEWGSGLQQKDFGPGFHLDLGPLHSWELFDGTVQTLSMISDDPAGALSVKSADGQNVTLDITVKYRIKAGECWQLRDELGTGDYYKTKVRNEAVDELRDIFGTMNTDNFYDPTQRAAKVAAADTAVSVRLAKLHVELIDILVRDVAFVKSYEDQLKNKALEGEKKKVNDAQREAARFRGETQKIIAETAAKVTVINEGLEKTRRELTAENEKAIAMIKADADQYVTETRADADLYKAEKLAAAALLTKNAEAEAQRLRQTALQGPGARNLVALEAAKGLNLDRIVISTMDNNVLDLTKFAEKLGATPGKEGK